MLNEFTRGLRQHADQLPWGNDSEVTQVMLRDAADRIDTLAAELFDKERGQRPNVDLAYAMLRGWQCGHLTNPSPRQLDQAREIIAQTYDLPGNVAMERIAAALGLKRCKCCKEAKR